MIVRAIIALKASASLRAEARRPRGFDPSAPPRLAGRGMRALCVAAGHGRQPPGGPGIA